MHRRQWQNGLGMAAWQRVILGLVWCVLACAMTVAVEWRANVVPPAEQPASPPEQSTVAVAVPLTIESTYDVAQWQIQVLGVAQVAQFQDGNRWRGQIDVPPGERVFIQALGSTEEDAKRRCLRIRLGSAPESFHWARGDVTVTLDLPESAHD